LNVLFFATRWGFAHVPWPEFCQQVNAAGYDGIEAGLPTAPAEKQQAQAALRQHGLRWIAHENTNALPTDFAGYRPAYERVLRQHAADKPLYVNVQSGKDYFSFEQNLELLDLASRVSTETGVPILHETHRGKFSFHPQVTRRYLDARPALRLTLDASHWCNVSESLLEDQAEAVQAAIARTDYVHTRVGHAEGPQVSDPRAPEWKAALDAHLAWWDAVVQAHAGSELLAMSPEFGAPPYLPTLPHTRQPVVDQWEVNKFMLDLLKARYA
jgi:sugar phosphate isomerase/epimerase